MEIFIERSKESIQKTFSGSVSALLSSLEILPETVLVTKDGIILTEDESLDDGDNIKILSVVSGG